MDAELKQKWIAALRSGEFKQGKHRFQTPDGAYCCLGVLCVAAGKEPMKALPSVAICSNYAAVHKDFGIPYETTITLEAMNDREGKSFAEIADYIEANL